MEAQGAGLAERDFVFFYTKDRENGYLSDESYGFTHEGLEYKNVVDFMSIMAMDPTYGALCDKFKDPEVLRKMHLMDSKRPNRDEVEKQFPRGDLDVYRKELGLFRAITLKHLNVRPSSCTLDFLLKHSDR